MEFHAVEPARVAREWPRIAETLWPAVRQNSHFTLETLRARLLADPKPLDHLLELSGEADCLLVLEVDDDLCCWVKGLAGAIHGGPKRRIRTIRETIQFIEQMARNAGCTEIRICGRDWSRFLTDYTPFDGFMNGIRKGL